MASKLELLKRHLEAAAENGWSASPALVAVRVSVHTVPDDACEEWRAQKNYHCIEILDFAFTRLDRVPAVMYTAHIAPAAPGHAQRISYSLALELLAQPQADSALHTNH